MHNVQYFGPFAQEGDKKEERSEGKAICNPARQLEASQLTNCIYPVNSITPPTSDTREGL